MKRMMIIAFLCLPLAALSQWQADLVNRLSSDTEKHYTVRSDGQKYRYDLTDNNMQIAMIIDPAANSTALLLVDEMKVRYSSYGDARKNVLDPMQIYHELKRKNMEADEGREEISEITCRKKTLYDKDGNPLLTAWFFDEINFAMKMQGHGNADTYMLLNNLREWDVDPSVFLVPAGYTEVGPDLKP